MRNRYGVDGVMIGRASIGNPWFFNQVKHFMKTGYHLPLPTINERVDAAKFHLLKSLEWKGDKLGVVEMRRHYANYFRGIQNFKEYRMKLVTEDSPENLLQILDDVVGYYQSELV
jgi:tRNA-dihydrouridine synthase